ncbi:MAG: hypothetical protein AAFW47_03610 [Pseudomonadota bacterium]
MTHMISTKTVSGIVGAALASALLLPLTTGPSAAQQDACTSGLVEVDNALATTNVEPATMARVTALRENALALQAQGDVEGCVRDVGDIKTLLGL